MKGKASWLYLTILLQITCVSSLISDCGIINWATGTDFNKSSEIKLFCNIITENTDPVKAD